MNRSDRERATAIINQHIEQGKQYIRDKRFLLDILHRDLHRMAIKFRWPWKTAEQVDPKMLILYREIDRANNEIDAQRSKNTQLRELRESIMIRAMAGRPFVPLLTDAMSAMEGPVIVA